MPDYSPSSDHYSRNNSELSLREPNDRTIFGGTRDDILQGGDGNDTIYGNAGNDWLYGDKGDDTIYGNVGDDWLYGGKGNDTIYGNGGNDRLYGGDGNDELWGNGGRNVLTGEAGIDKFVISPHANARDTIRDFDVTNEKIDLQDFSNIKSFKQLVITQKGAHTQINLGGNQRVILNNVTASDLTMHHFIFKNEKPVAVNDDFTTPKNRALGISKAALLANDTDREDKTPIFATVKAQPSHGILVDNNDDTFTYVPSSTLERVDFFVYEVTDSAGKKTEATVYITLSKPDSDGDILSMDTDESYIAPHSGWVAHLTL